MLKWLSGKGESPKKPAGITSRQVGVILGEMRAEKAGMVSGIFEINKVLESITTLQNKMKEVAMSEEGSIELHDITDRLKPFAEELNHREAQLKEKKEESDSELDRQYESYCKGRDGLQEMLSSLDKQLVSMLGKESVYASQLLRNKQEEIKSLEASIEKEKAEEKKLVRGVRTIKKKTLVTRKVPSPQGMLEGMSPGKRTTKSFKTITEIPVGLEEIRETIGDLELSRQRTAESIDQIKPLNDQIKLINTSMETLMKLYDTLAANTKNNQQQIEEKLATIAALKKQLLQLNQYQMNRENLVMEVTVKTELDQKKVEGFLPLIQDLTQEKLPGIIEELHQKIEDLLAEMNKMETSIRQKITELDSAMRALAEYQQNLSTSSPFNPKTEKLIMSHHPIYTMIEKNGLLGETQREKITNLQGIEAYRAPEKIYMIVVASKTTKDDPLSKPDQLDFALDEESAKSRDILVKANQKVLIYEMTLEPLTSLPGAEPIKPSTPLQELVDAKNSEQGKDLIKYIPERKSNIRQIAFTPPPTLFKISTPSGD